VRLISAAVQLSRRRTILAVRVWRIKVSMRRMLIAIMNAATKAAFAKHVVTIGRVTTRIVQRRHAVATPVLHLVQRPLLVLRPAPRPQRIAVVAYTTTTAISVTNFAKTAAMIASAASTVVETPPTALRTAAVAPQSPHRRLRLRLLLVHHLHHPMIAVLVFRWAKAETVIRSVLQRHKTARPASRTAGTTVRLISAAVQRSRRRTTLAVRAWRIKVPMRRMLIAIMNAATKAAFAKHVATIGRVRTRIVQRRHAVATSVLHLGLLP
jgi:hypothetical protein